MKDITTVDNSGSTKTANRTSNEVVSQAILYPPLSILVLEKTAWERARYSQL